MSLNKNTIRKGRKDILKHKIDVVLPKMREDVFYKYMAEAKTEKDIKDYEREIKKLEKYEEHLKERMKLISTGKPEEERKRGKYKKKDLDWEDKLLIRLEKEGLLKSIPDPELAYYLDKNKRSKRYRDKRTRLGFLKPVKYSAEKRDEYEKIRDRFIQIIKEESDGKFPRADRPIRRRPRTKAFNQRPDWPIYKMYFYGKKGMNIPMYIRHKKAVMKGEGITEEEWFERYPTSK